MVTHFLIYKKKKTFIFVSCLFVFFFLVEILYIRLEDRQRQTALMQPKNNTLP